MKFLYVFRNKAFRIIVIPVLLVMLLLIFLNPQRYGCENCNLILISIDTLRADHMGIYGYQANTTPNIDNLSSKGVLFEKAHTIFPETWESFYTLFTGRDDFFMDQKMYLTKINDKNYSIPTLTTALRNKGYKTAAFVTNPALKYPFFSKGFDEFNFFNESKKNDFTSFLYDYDNSINLTESASKWLKNNLEEKFFLWLHYTNLHSPYTPPAKYICKLDTKCDLKQYDDFLNEESPYSILKDCKNISAKKIELASRLYDAELLSVDEQIGRLVKSLEKLNLTKNTLIVIYGDHGEGLDHNIFAHGDALYESETHIPFIVINPNSKKLIRINSLLDNTQIKDLLIRMLTEKSVNINLPKKEVYSVANERYSKTYSILNGDYKYISSENNLCTQLPSEELYNLKKDPKELNNIINNHKMVVTELRKKLIEKIQSTSKKEVPPDQEILDKLKSLGY